MFTGELILKIKNMIGDTQANHHCHKLDSQEVLYNLKLSKEGYDKRIS